MIKFNLPLNFTTSQYSHQMQPRTFLNQKESRNPPISMCAFQLSLHHCVRGIWKELHDGLSWLSAEPNIGPHVIKNGLCLFGWCTVQKDLDGKPPCPWLFAFNFITTNSFLWPPHNGHLTLCVTCDLATVIDRLVVTLRTKPAAIPDSTLLYMYVCWHNCMNKPHKQRVLMHRHQGLNVRHGLCYIYMRYLYIYELFIAFVCFVVCSLL